MGGSGHGDGVFLHGFEEGGLCFGCGAIDFVSQQDVGEQWAFLKIKDSTTIR